MSGLLFIKNITSHVVLPMEGYRTVDQKKQDTSNRRKTLLSVARYVQQEKQGLEDLLELVEEIGLWLELDEHLRRTEKGRILLEDVVIPWRQARLPDGVLEATD